MSSHRATPAALVASSLLLTLTLGSGCWFSGTSTVSGTSSAAGSSSGPTGSGGASGPSASTSATVDLAATGQTTSFGDGDDGEHQMGEAIDAVTRFLDNGDGTITDQLTGLMWLQDASCLIHNYEEWESDGWADGWVPWRDAFLFIAQINSGRLSACGAGYTDWRLPNVIELESLINAGQADPAQWLIDMGFQGVEDNDYWTSTTDPDTITTFAYVVVFGDGSVSRLGNKATAPAITSVWPVRDTTDGSTTELWQTGQTTSYVTDDDGDLQMGVAWPDPRFTDNGDGTITDNLTGLVWLQDGDAFGVPNWYQALTIVDQFNTDPNDFDCTNYTASYTDWRLPNRKEYFSLADFSQCGPALPVGHPFINISTTATYWSSTTFAGDRQYAWHYDPRTGEVSTDFKVNGHRFMLVR
jgi:hypothetical protein